MNSCMSFFNYQKHWLGNMSLCLRICFILFIKSIEAWRKMKTICIKNLKLIRCLWCFIIFIKPVAKEMMTTRCLQRFAKGKCRNGKEWVNEILIDLLYSCLFGFQDRVSIFTHDRQRPMSFPASFKLIWLRKGFGKRFYNSNNL